jgi:phosphatidylinositol glycan class H protein
MRSSTLDIQEPRSKMPGPVCALRVLKPTPTTVCFTVSTRAPLKTRASRYIHHFLLTLRFLLACQVLLLLWTQWQLLAAKEHGKDVPPWILNSGPGRLATWASDSMMPRYLVPVALFALWLILRRGYTGTFLSYFNEVYEPLDWAKWGNQDS